ncbi:MAG: CDP-alcohol phosphatidyltransferase family protein [Candidatus Neomarinimicrobiota bacterium]
MADLSQATAWKPRLANLITFTTLAMAIASIALSIEGAYRLACALILTGYLLDGVDGEVARRMGGISDFGTQLDSLVDLVHFGVAITVLISQHLRNGPVGGWPIWVFLVGYVIAACFRLARFNLADGNNKQVTTGLTISTGGAYLTLTVLANLGFGQPFVSDWIFLPLLLIVSLLMVSRIPFPDLKGLLHYRVPVLATFGAGALVSLWLSWEFGLFAMWTVYVLFGTIRAGIRAFD